MVQVWPLTSPVRPLVEREHEVGVLGSLLDDVVAGRGRAAWLLGPAGAGKTALLRSLAAMAEERGARTWAASAGQLESRLPFGVVRRLLDRAVRGLGRDRLAALEEGPARLALAHLWSVRSMAGADPEPARRPHDGLLQGDMLHSLGWLLEELVGTSPHVLTIDDAQWADEESLTFLASLRERLEGLATLVVVTARGEAVDRSAALATLVAHRDAVVLRPALLTTPGIRALLGQVWERVPTDTADAVREVTGGNPFLVLALAEMVADQAASRDDRAVAPHEVRDIVPETVTDLVVARLADLSPAESALTRALAVLDTADLATTAALADLDLETAAGAADRLRRAGLLAEGATLAFRHALLRSAVEAVVGTDTVAQLHRRAARLLADGLEVSVPGAQDAGHGPHQGVRSDVAGAAAHLLAAPGTGDAWAVAVLRRAAAEAMAYAAPRSAVALLSRAVEEPAGPAELPGLLLELGQAQMRIFDPACVETLRRAEALVVDPAQRVPCSLALATAYSFAGLHELASGTLAAAYETVAGTDPELELVVDAAWAAVGLHVPGQVAATRHRLARRGELRGRTAGERLLLVQQLTVAAGTNQPAATIRSFAHRVVGPWDSPEQYPESGDWVWPRLFLARVGDHDEARRLAAEGLGRAQADGSVAGVVAASFVMAFNELDAGALPEAEACYRAMIDHGTAVDGAAPADGGSVLIDTLGRGGLAQSLVLQGRVEEAVAVLDAFPVALPASTPLNGAMMVWIARSLVRQAQGDHVGALAAADKVGQLLSELMIDSPTWFPWRVLAVEALRSMGRTEEARLRADEHLALCERSEVPHLVGEALCLAGSVAADPAQGLALAARGAALLAGTTARLRVGNASLVYGSMLRRAGHRVEAREHLRTALTVLSGCGAAPAAQFAQAELVAAGGRHIGGAGLPRLTPSEHRVAELAIAGLGNREIAARLYVTRKTVETHLSAVYRKLAIEGRDQLRPEHLDGGADAVGAPGAER